MDITAEYRTKSPPKEHEEAVRMLLEEINSKLNTKPYRSDNSTRQVSSQVVSSKVRDPTSTDTMRMHIRDDSSSSNESASIGHDAGIGSATNSKSTSTSVQSTDSLSQASSQGSKSSDNDRTFGEPIPSRTIAVQCDLKSSTVKRNEQADSDTGVQASSISSTRFGFYCYSHETLERRRRQMQAEAATKRIEHRRARQIEAPTSMSELSIVSSGRLAQSRQDLSSDQQQQHHHQSRGQRKIRQQVNGLSSQDNNISKSPANLRVNSLPRRPKTAMSFVSANRLRDAEHDDGSADESITDRYSVDKYKYSLKNGRKARSQLDLLRSPTPMSPGLAESSSSDECNKFNQIVSEARRKRHQVRDKPASQLQDNLTSYQRSNNMMKLPLYSSMKDERQAEVVKSHSTIDRQSRQSLSRERSEDSRDIMVGRNRRLPFVDSNVRKDSLPDTNKFNSLRNVSSDIESKRKYGTRKFTNEHIDDIHNNTKMDNSEFSQFGNINQRKEYEMESSGRSRGYPEYADEIIQTSRQMDNSQRNNNIQTSYTSLSRPPKRSTNMIHQQMMNQRSMRTHESQQDASLRSNMIHRQFNENQARPEKIQRSRTIISGRSPLVDYPVQDNIGPSQMSNVGRRKLIANSRANGRVSNELNRSTSMRYSDEQNFMPIHDHRRLAQESDSSADSDSPSTRTWANPLTSRRGLEANDVHLAEAVNRRLKALRSTSARDINRCEQEDELIFQSGRNPRYGRGHRALYGTDSSSDSSSQQSDQRLFDTYYAQQLDHNSQHMLNESGLPEVYPKHEDDSRQSKHRSHNNYPTISSTLTRDRVPSQYQTNSMAEDQSSIDVGMIPGRAWSQQSLARPTMPTLTRGRRRNGSNSGGSDVGGSSMSLVSRLNGRFETARTRTPVVMYIPQSTTRPELPMEVNTLDGRSSKARKGNRSNMRASSSQMGSKRSLTSKQESDTDTSMLRTLIKPRQVRNQNQSDYDLHNKKSHPVKPESRFDREDEEDIDNLGRLASELDSYKFSRRYSVPKDAKINWFSKLRQKVSMVSK